MNIYEVRQYVPHFSAFILAMKTPNKKLAFEKKKRIEAEGKKAYVAKKEII